MFILLIKELIMVCFSSEAPSSPSITSTAEDVHATSLTVKWAAPADDGGSPITAYRVVVLHLSTEIRNENITDPGARQKFIGGLSKNANYNLKVYARNYVFEGDASQTTLKTNFEGANFYRFLHEI